MSYITYRKQGLRNAWSLAGMERKVEAVLKGVGLLLIAAGIALAVVDQAQAINDEADTRVAAKLTSQTSEIEALRGLLAACLGEKEGALFIGGELYLCRAVPTGVRK